MRGIEPDLNPLVTFRCHTEYDDVWEEKCSTLYEDQCSIVSK
jgi:hypothetical protein